MKWNRLREETWTDGGRQRFLISVPCLNTCHSLCGKVIEYNEEARDRKRSEFPHARTVFRVTLDNKYSICAFQCVAIFAVLAPAFEFTDGENVVII